MKIIGGNIYINIISRNKEPCVYTKQKSSKRTKNAMRNLARAQKEKKKESASGFLVSAQNNERDSR